MEGKDFVDVEDEMFKALTNRTRRDIIRAIGARDGMGFNELLRGVNLADSSQLSYHLRTLSLFLDQIDEKYVLSGLGRNVYGLLLGADEQRGKFLHRGMVMTKEEHERWHGGNPELSPEEHGKMMRGMGITEEQDREWHRDNRTPSEGNRAPDPVNPFMVGGGFIDYCVGKGWMTREGKGRSTRYYVTERGREEIGKYGIKI